MYLYNLHTIIVWQFSIVVLFPLWVREVMGSIPIIAPFFPFFAKVETDENPLYYVNQLVNQENTLKIKSIHI